QFQGEHVQFDHFKNLYSTEAQFCSGMCPKLSYAHIYPNTWQKMTVKLCTQLFSESVACAFEYFADDLKLESFKDTKPTIKMVRMLNNAFDVMNGRCRSESINKSNWPGKKKILEETLDAIEMTETISAELKLTPFMSQTTLEALRLTLHSFIALTEDLLNNSYDFILTGKFNQDCVEDAVTSGNVDQREQLQLLVSYKDCLLGKCKTERKKASFLRSKEALLMEKEPPSEEDLMMANIKKHMVYNLCGYVLYSRKNFFKCQDCRNTLETSFALLP
ncbi:Uncharacterized protein APZ42_007352, partial [Daphnia magna]